jgi:hypothetical protein
LQASPEGSVPSVEAADPSGVEGGGGTDVQTESSPSAQPPRALRVHRSLS